MDSRSLLTPLVVLQVMTAASLPSTLVKCLYIFFDLVPEIESPATDATPLQTDKESTDFSASERRILLQKVFVQVSVVCVSQAALFLCYKVCRHQHLPSLLWAPVSASRTSLYLKKVSWERFYKFTKHFHIVIEVALFLYLPLFAKTKQYQLLRSVSCTLCH